MAAIPDAHISSIINWFKSLAMRVVLDKAPEQGSEVADFIDELKKNHPCLHFKPIPAAPAAEPPETLPATDAATDAALPIP